MRPDMDDYAEIDESKPLGGSRAMSWMVLAIAVGGFAALAYFAYHSGANTVSADELMVVEADGAPIKEAPTTPDGAEFANQDKTIYDVISPGGAAQTGEKLLPEPERPVAAANIEDSEDDIPATATTTATPAAPVTPSAPAVTPAVPATTQSATTTTYVATPTPPAAKPVDAQAAAAATTAALSAAVPAASKPVEVAPAITKPVEKSFSAPELVNEKPAPKPVVAAAEKPKTVAKPKVEKTAAKQSAGGAYKLQLGAFKSEEEAQAAWKKISAKHGSVLSGAPTIVKAEVNGGIFYRLRAGSYANADAAKAACAKLGGQACFPTK